MKRLSNNMEYDKQILQIVPWYNKREWEKTYHDAYSEDLERQEKSYTQMCIWKSRQFNLAFGVECTMSMLHVRLCDRQKNSSYKEKDLQLLYSTSVMRFLNHLTAMSNCKDSMYKMAKQEGIPDWLINLRHEAAHGNSLPALYLLQQASDIIMKWLQDNYWEIEAADMQDCVVETKHRKENEYRSIKDLLNLWVALKINFWAGRKIIDNIPEEDIKKKAMELAKEQGLGIQLSPDVDTKKHSSKNTSEQFESDEIVAVAGGVHELEYTHKIRTALEPLLRQIFDPLKKKKSHKTHYEECLIQTLINCEGFCPQINIEILDESEIQQLMSLMAELWKELLEELQSYDLLPQLMRSLMLLQSSDPQLMFGHLWLRLFTELLSGQLPLHPCGTESLCQLLADSLPYKVDPKVLLHKVNLHHVKHQRPINLKTASAREIDVLEDLAGKALYQPTKFTTKYLYSLLGFWPTPINDETKKRLCEVAEVYVGQKRIYERANQVFTLSSLLNHGLVIDSPDVVMETDHNSQESPWKLYSGNADWSKCALGVLPWD